jgi:cell division septal protein FtsQ
MFKRKNKDKNNRFQKITFTHNLDRARNFKREVNKPPQFAVSKFLAVFGVRSWLSLLTSLVVFVGLCYLLLFPNFLWVKKIEVSGLPKDHEAQVEQFIRDEISNKKARIFAGQNLLFVSSQDLTKKILQQFPDIKTVTKFSKIFPDQLKVTVETRNEEYLLINKKDNYLLYNDGAVSKIFQDNPKTLPAIPFIFYSWKDNSYSVGEYAISSQQLKSVQQIRTILKNVYNLPVTAVAFGPIVNPEIQPEASTSDISIISTSTATSTLASTKKYRDAFISLAPNDIVVYVDRGSYDSSFYIYFQLGDDLLSKIDRFGDLYNQMEATRKANLSYMDLRFDERAFLCVKNSPCEAKWNFGF